ncbi:Trans-2,3-dihydro-3-hydroxyanthranilate isomerase [Granulosicoccus antarcticus IMCC3135]|uniref:Trans-2,3-dihydro-3-hydroxyanthranilate isomerase n=2 Tax=Granulosicoccus TaxID=437504 RepID=A0A2Z2NPM7_9GAMM|nr:Trans-2,3-dihydro-3-hydroxyanthranilate isomerase [Granulosicoccus antarcticus IMCC3135]
MQVDVFTATPTRGNALAVVLDADGLTDEQMQVFARWTNLAETTFLFPPDNEQADYSLRIFTPVREMPFAGHPTLGSCAAWLRAGGTPKNAGSVIQDCGVGLVEIDLQGEVPAFVAPPTAIDELPPADAKQLAEALGLQAADIVRTAKLNNGPVWQVFQLRSAAAVLAANAAAVNWATHKPIGLIGPHTSNHECDHEVRMLAPSSGMSEDPITGSLNAAIAHWMQSIGELERDLIIAQGTSIDRQGRVYIRRGEAGRVLIGGQSHVLIDGELTL